MKMKITEMKITKVRAAALSTNHHQTLVRDATPYTRRNLLVLGLLTGMSLSFAPLAGAQIPVDPNPIPFPRIDLSVSVAAPAVIYGYGYDDLVTITVNNLDPFQQATTATDVSVLGYFTGVQPLWVQADSGFNCSVSQHPTSRWKLSCSNGTIAAGGSGTIQVSVLVDSTNWYWAEGGCIRNWPAYTDVRVSTSINEVRYGNNRAVAVTDGFDACIN